MIEKQILGRIGENIACEYLEDKGYKILVRNFRCKQGEIDIIAQDKKEIVFIEVKTRENLICGLPSEAVNKQKRMHIVQACKYFLYKNRLEARYIRFDIVEVYKRDKYYVNHIRNIDIFGSFIN